MRTKTEEETMLGKKKKLSDDQLEEVNGGQQVIVVKAPKYIPTVLRFFLKQKRFKNNRHRHQTRENDGALLPLLRNARHLSRSSGVFFVS